MWVVDTAVMTEGDSRFTNTAIPRFNGTGCWQQHILIVQAIVRSNGWSLMTAALQLFAHLDGEALNVALLMPVKQRERWKDLVDGLSDYYNSPGRLAGCLTAIREHESPVGNGSGYICHGAGDPCNARICGHG